MGRRGRKPAKSQAASQRPAPSGSSTTPTMTRSRAKALARPTTAGPVSEPLTPPQTPAAHGAPTPQAGGPSEVDDEQDLSQRSKKRRRTLRQLPSDIQSPTTKRVKKAAPVLLEGVKKAASDPQASEEIKAMDEFFRFRPPKLTPHPKHRPSDSSKEPQFYDRHLHSERILKRVYYCPEIETDVRNLADEVVLQRLSEGTLPPISKTFPTEKRRNPVVNDVSNLRMVSEASVVQYYEQTTAKFASTVAATLHFGHSRWSAGALEWKIEHVGQGSDAIADGYLSLDSGRVEAKDLSAVPLDQVSNFENQVILTWEFKSTRVGKESLMIALMELAGKPKYDWTGCELGHLSDACKYSHKPGPKTVGEFVTYKPDQGPDASGEKANKLWNSVLTAPTDRTWVHNRQKYSKQDMDVARKHALYIFQQGWAQATKLDLTLFVINVGPFEIFCKRDRIGQALYVSDIIEVWNTDYGQLHVGLYLASIRDAEIRIALKEALAQANGKIPQGPQARTSTQADRLTQACFRNKLVLHFTTKIRQMVLDGETPWCREGKRYFRVPSLRNDYPSDVIRVQISKAIPRTSVFVGTLWIDNIPFAGFKNARYGIDVHKGVIVKVADNEEDVGRLQKEYAQYMELAKHAEIRPFVPIVIGFFSSRKKSRMSCILLLENAGDDLKTATQKGAKSKMATLEKPFKEALEILHEAAEILHSNLHAHHLIVRSYEMKTVAFISFADARKARTQQELENEQEDLALLFPKKKRPAVSCSGSLASVDLSTRGSVGSSVGTWAQRMIVAFPHAEIYGWINPDLVPIPEEGVAKNDSQAETEMVGDEEDSSSSGESESDEESSMLGEGDDDEGIFTTGAAGQSDEWDSADDR